MPKVVDRKPLIRKILAAGLTFSLVYVGISNYRDSAVRAQSKAPAFLEFESDLVRPLAMSPDGTKLFATNTPNGTLEIFNITSSGALSPLARVAVGLEPVAVAAASNSEVWVVNHLSDSVSVVTLAGTPHVTHTLLVGDEPRDIVFAGSPARAFITTAHRGQQRTDPSIANVPGAGDPQFTTPSVPRAERLGFRPGESWDQHGGHAAKDYELLYGYAARAGGERRREHGFCSGLQNGQSNYGCERRADLPEF